MFNWLFKKKVSILNEQDILKLKEIQRNAYMEEAEKIMVEKGKQQAHNDLEIKPVKNNQWQI